MTMAVLIETTPFGCQYRGAWVNQNGQGNVITSSELAMIYQTIYSLNRKCCKSMTWGGRANCLAALLYAPHPQRIFFSTKLIFRSYEYGQTQKTNRVT